MLERLVWIENRPVWRILRRGDAVYSLTFLGLLWLFIIDGLHLFICRNLPWICFLGIDVLAVLLLRVSHEAAFIIWNLSVNTCDFNLD
jgi:hypothetical protein